MGPGDLFFLRAEMELNPEDYPEVAAVLNDLTNGVTMTIQSTVDLQDVDKARISRLLGAIKGIDPKIPGLVLTEGIGWTFLRVSAVVSNQPCLILLLKDKRNESWKIISYHSLRY
jgi:hypothetical protein